MDERGLNLRDTSSITEYLGNWLWNSLDLGYTSVDIDDLMRFVGELCNSERAYVFEIDEANGTISNTYEWCALGVTPQKDLLQNESIFFVEGWIELFKQKQPVIIPNVEMLKTNFPAVYAILKPQNISSLVAVPVFFRDMLLGFLGLDNPEHIVDDEIIPVLNKIGSLFAHIIKQRKLEESISFNKYHDPLTLSFNRFALERDFEETAPLKTLGIISCDLSELKSTNDEFGFAEGDAMICSCNAFLKEIFDKYNIYRVSGDRFAVVCPDVDRVYFEELVMLLEDQIEKRKDKIVFGYYWSNESPLSPFDIFSEAEKNLHHNKVIYYNKPDPSSGKSRNRRTKIKDIDNFKDNQTGKLHHFINNNYFSLETFFKSLEKGDSYHYFGDLQNNVWFISDSMKENWGFDNNVVYDFLNKWKKFISNKEDLEIYEKEIAELVKLKRDEYDLIYRVSDINGEESWVHCFGYTKWDEDKNHPLFFSGQISRLANAFDIDPLTNFQKEKAAIRDISTMFFSEEVSSFLCFRLNGFGEINEIRGRYTGNNLIKDIGVSLLNEFDDDVKFYRLDGLRFLAMVSDKCEIEIKEISSRIKKTVSDLYTEYNLPIRYPCSVGILGEFNSNLSVFEFMTDIISVLDIAKNKPETDIIYSTQTLNTHREQKQMVLEISKDVVNNMNNFRVVMQPIVSSMTERVVGGELLLRWQYLGQDVSPIVFVPILEENNLMPVVGKWVFKEAVKLCKRINYYNPDFYLDFNVSYHQIKDETLLPYMEKVLNDYEVDGRQLVMELTETHYNDDPIKLQKFIESCKSMNMKMALDDFGVGYSSLEMLLKYPANIVKIDRSLMKKMSDSPDSKIFISTIVSACHNFDRMVCVEGVEMEKELNMVTEAGCDTVQGFYFYKPMEMQNVYGLFASLEEDEQIDASYIKNYIENPV